MKFHISHLSLFKICSLIFRNLPKTQSMHHILHNDLHFLHHTCRANPAGSVFYTGVLVHKSAFLTDFTLRALLKRWHCVSLMFWVKTDRKFSVSTTKRVDFFKNRTFFKKNVSRNCRTKRCHENILRYKLTQTHQKRDKKETKINRLNLDKFD